MRFVCIFAVFAAAISTARAEVLTIEPSSIVEWKAVFGTVEARDRVPARVRIGGTVISLDVTEGDSVEAGQTIATVEDDKLAFQLDSIDARLSAANAQLETARADLERGGQLLEQGVVTAQRLDQLQTQVDVILGEIRSLESERLVVEQRITEGEVLAPDSGVVLSVPISEGSVVTPGETAAVIGGGGVFLRLAVPERHAGNLAEGDEIEIGDGGGEMPGEKTGRLVKLYPEIEGGRVQADVEVPGLDSRFIGRRLPVRLPVAERTAILVPQRAFSRKGGLDFVTVETAAGEAVDRTVVLGNPVMQNGRELREVLTGLVPGDNVVIDDE